MNIRIKKERKANGLTQEDLAELLGVSLMTVRRWEWGERSPNFAILPKLAEVLNTSVTYLMGVGETDSPNRPPAGTRATNPVPAPQRGDIDITIPPTADAGQPGRIVYEWGGDNRLELPDTPEGRAEMMKFIKEIMAAGYVMDSAEMKQDAEPPPASSPAPDGASRSA